MKLGKFILGQASRKVIDFIGDSIDKLSPNVWYTVNITGLAWTADILTEVFSCLSVSESSLKREGDRCQTKDLSILTTTGDNDKSYAKIWHGVIIFLDVHSVRDNNVTVFLRTFNEKRSKETLHEFIERVKKAQMKRMEHRWRYVTAQNMPGRGSFRNICHDIKRRTFNDTFMKSEDRDLLIDSIDKFVEQRDWYERNNIPYHFGVLLYGAPGTGKTVIAQAIAEHINARLLVLNGDDIGRIDEDLSNISYRPSENMYTVLLIEDVDCGFTKRGYGYMSDNNDDTKENIGLATILNIMDGIDAPRNVIYVLTTNHIENLDPALIRPGRCDLKIEIGNVCEETFKQFIKYHFNQYINYPIHINKNITFAELQTYIMRGYTVDQLIELVTGGNDNEDSEHDRGTGTTDCLT